jgi:ATP-dependent DNA ligase
LAEPFDDPDWVWEAQYDGFRALAFVRGGVCRFESRDSHTLTQFPDLARAVARTIRGHEAVLDGEIVCLDAYGRPDFRALMARAGETVYAVFDLLEHDAHDVCASPLEQRKEMLAGLLSERLVRTLLVEHVPATGRDLFAIAREHDLEGVVGKWRHGRYVGALPTSSWVKVGNPSYSQGRGGLSEGGTHAASERPVRLVLE